METSVNVTKYLAEKKKTKNNETAAEWIAIENLYKEKFVSNIILSLKIHLYKLFQAMERTDS